MVLSRIMSQFATTIPNSKISIGNFYRQFFPSIFEKLSIKEAKMHGLLECLDEREPVPSNLVDILICLDEFIFYPASSQISFVVFGVCLHFLQKSSQLFESVKSFLLRTILQHPKFIKQIISVLQQSFYPPKSNVVIRLLRSFDELLQKMNKSQLHKYTELVERIVQEPAMPPTVGNLIPTLKKLLHSNPFFSK